MNAVMDLTARAVAFITAAQTTLLKGAIAAKREAEEISILNTPPEEFEQLFREFVSTEQKKHSEEGNDSEEDSFAARAVELVWIVGGEANPDASAEYTIYLCLRVKDWITENKARGIQQLQKEFGTYPTPFNWRETIKKIVCEHPEQRLALAQALQYLPVQIILAVGGGPFGLREQRVMQIWNMEEEFQQKLLDDGDMQTLRSFDKLLRGAEFSPEKLLILDKTLVDQLLQHKAPLSFEQVFASELQEIELNRKRRDSEQRITTERAIITNGEEQPNSDPYQVARQMHLHGLAFSGGGIRSATFNLGILQGLATQNMIGRFDYLSTVSGGGYIGSWLAAWIKREGSVVKVSDRLCTDKSPDPLGEELRPIRWLRMYSNYFAPQASFMSADSWTIAITWLRNTLLNQVIIFLLLLAVLFGGNFIFELWVDYLRQPVHGSTWGVLLYGMLSLVPTAILSGLGMHAYTRNKIRWIPISPVMTNVVKYGILGVAIVAAYFLSAWMCSPWYFKNINTWEFPGKLRVMVPAAVTAFVCLLLVALIGKYYDLIRASKRSLRYAWAVIAFASFLTAGIGWIALATGWTLLQQIVNTKSSFICEHLDQMEFIIGLPIMLEVFSITLVARMALLGRYFPDERREWWGRMGALVHRFSFLWIVVGTSALLGKDVMDNFFESDFPKVMTALGGWAVLVGGAVKAAFSSKVPGEKEGSSTLSRFLNVFSLIGPYVFMLGLLVFLPALIPPLNSLASGILSGISEGLDIPLAQIGLLIIVSTVVAFVLADRIGVNEFSMHHFYRNRLVRAYLGATRRDTDRRRTYNPFTNFDMNDDEFLATMQNKSGYYGPYPILNVALNASQVVDLDRQDRKAESFIFSPLYCGFDFSMIKASADLKAKSYDYAYRPTADYGYRNGGPYIGTAMAISGAAVNPNHGYHSSPATSFLLTIFNVQMGWWMGNPRKSYWRESEPGLGIGYIIANLVGRTSTRDKYVALSDGGHFDNMGLYELVRRRCPVILLCDAEQDGDFACEGFANAIRRCRIDFGAEIRIDISGITTRNSNGCSAVHYAVGNISYAGDRRPSGKIIYVKSSITGDEPVDVHEYGTKNDTFPHQSTADQFFDEEQFESYRKLGMHIAAELLSDPDVRSILP